MRARTNPFFLVAALYLTVGLIAVVGKLTVEVGLIDSLPRLRWLTIHLVTIGAMTEALFGALPHLVASVGGTDRTPPVRGRWLQWLGLNAGYPLVLVGMVSGSTLTAVAGATVVLLALGLLVVSVYHTSVEADGGVLVRHYATAPWFLVVGIFAAFGMLLNVHGPGGYFGSIEAHVHANVWGFLALVVAGTLLAVVPKMAGVTLRYPQLKRVTFWGLALGATGLVAGPWLAIHAITFSGLAIYVVGTLALLANLVATRRAGGCEKDSRFAHVLGAYLWLVFPVPWAPLVLLYPSVVPAVPIETAAINGLVFGWMLQLAIALLPDVAESFGGDGPIDVLETVGESGYRPSWVGVATANVGMLAIWLTAFPTVSSVSDALTVAGFALVAVAWGLFLPDLWRAVTGESTIGRPGNLADGPATRESPLD